MTVSSIISPSLRIGLRFLGLWPNESYPTLYIYMTSILIAQYFQYLYISTHFKFSEISNLVDGVMSTLVYSLMFLKLASLWIHRPVIHKILAAIDNDWRECINVEQHLYMMTNKANISHFYSNCMLGITIFAGILYGLGDYAIHVIHFIKNHNESGRQLPLKVQLPFKTDQSPIFEFLFIILFLLMITTALTMAIINATIFSLVLHVSGQIDIMCQEFSIVSKQISVYNSSKSPLKMLIKRHNRIILFSDNIEKFFSFIALMQVVWNTLILCCLGIMIIISLYNEAGIIVLVKMSVGYFTVLLEIFILCFAGEYLSFQSKSITDAAYNMLWYNMSSKQVKFIILIIMKSQSQLTITAGRFMNLSLETFTNIMKSSLSFTSVFHAMY
ncbi:odorant receptor 4-like [Linepithema humile]|uniref:odorant receptor 4-like n=1 Tax=Linepithema humile TaxID=83485 RepID=UPI00351E3B9A